MTTPVIQLAGLQTENRNDRTVEINQASTLELCRLLNREDMVVPLAVDKCIPVIAEVIDTLSERVYNGGRVFYIGAGTSGRLGVLDASEIPPTYSVPSGRFIALIAGGDYALRHAKEGAEDERDGAVADLQAFDLDPEVDSLIGIASSGRTPYVLGGLSYVKSLGATTVALVCVSPSAAAVEGNVDHLIAAVTGPEAITGSTRMKAGTATKLILNMISTGIMVKLGKTYGNLMIDVKATNHKLKQRARNILRFVGGDACTQSDSELDHILDHCYGSVKLAAVTIVLNISVTEAKDRLQQNKGVLSDVFRNARKKEALPKGHGGSLVLCVDAGGTSCKAVIMAKDGEMGIGKAGPCNVTNIGTSAAMSTVSKAVQEAVDNYKATRGYRMGAVKLSAAWVGIAGYGRPSLSPSIDRSLSELLGLQLGTKLKITTDIDLLPVCVMGQAELDSVIVIVAGTGSIAMSYEKVDGRFRPMHRVGGWGHLLGDDGSGYSIGREALRVALLSSDLHRIRASEDQTSTNETLPRLSQAVVQYFRELYPQSTPDELLSTILVPDLSSHGAEDATVATTKRIASVAKLVLSLADSDDQAKHILETSVSRLVDRVMLVTLGRGVDTSKSGLVLAGGMTQNELYRKVLVRTLEEKCGKFKQTESVAEPAVGGAEYVLSYLV
ncbi:putative glucokinase regulator family protein [Xylaria venustula]|nr:putative glucokinase regulator family protein [Xylaria venustula]